MARQTFIYDPVVGGLVPKDEFYARHGSNGRPSGEGMQVIGDLAPYQSMQTGEIIEGRRQHREHLRQHGLIEVGNEKLPARAPIAPSGVRDDLNRAWERHKCQ